MKATQFKELTATALGVPPAGMYVTIRTLREAGFITFNGLRGRGAAERTLLDAAHVVVAYLAHERPGELAADRIAPLFNLSLVPSDAPLPTFSLEQAVGMPPRGDFVSAIYHLLLAYALGDQAEGYAEACGLGRDGQPTPPDCRIELHQLAEPVASIRLGQHLYHFDQFPTPVRGAAPPPPVERMAAIGTATIAAIGQAFAEEERAPT